MFSAGMKKNSSVHVYVLEGGTAILECNVHPSAKSTWDKSNSSSIQRNVIPYADGGEINTDLPNFNNLAIVGEISEGNYNLQIQNVSSCDEGVFICSHTSIESGILESNVTLQMKGKHFYFGKVVVHVMISINIYFVFIILVCADVFVLSFFFIYFFWREPFVV